MVLCARAPCWLSPLASARITPHTLSLLARPPHVLSRRAGEHLATPITNGVQCTDHQITFTVPGQIDPLPLFDIHEYQHNPGNHLPFRIECWQRRRCCICSAAMELSTTSMCNTQV